jgi:hypothetical protein
LFSISNLALKMCPLICSIFHPSVDFRPPPCPRLHVLWLWLNQSHIRCQNLNYYVKVSLQHCFSTYSFLYL